MSLFQAREWWSYQSEHNDAEQAHEAIAIDIGAFPKELGTQADVVVLGSLTGLLKILSPFQRENEEKEKAADHLLLEKHLPDPILQVVVGNLTSSSGDPKIGLLHPRLLSVYTLQRQKAKNKEQLDTYQLLLQYQHKLSRSAYSVVKGPFGRSKRDFLCVQSLDGTLNVFEQESFAFSRFLPNFLLPGPFCYVERADSFVTMSSSYQLECYKYQTMAVASEANDKVSDEMVKGKRITADWTVSIGESCTQMQVIQSKKKDVPSKIILLCAHSVQAVLDTGVVTFVRRLDFSPLCGHSFLSDLNPENVISLLSTDTDTLLILENTTLKWAAQLPFQPVSISRGSFKKSEDSKELVKELLVLVSKKGDLFVSYLGTDPTLYTAPNKVAREVNYESIDKQYEALSEQIKASQASDPGLAIASSSSRAELRMTASISGHIDAMHDSDSVPMTKIRIELRTSTPLSKVRVTLDMDAPLKVAQNSFTINSLSDLEAVETFAFLDSAIIQSSGGLNSSAAVPHCLDVNINAVYTSSQGLPQVKHQLLRLPLHLIMRACPPIKDAEYKVTLSTNKAPVSLLELFPEFRLDTTMANAAGFQYYGGPYVTLLSSKTSQRYRLQSDNLPALWVLTKEIEERLHKVYKNAMPRDSANDLNVAYSSSLPIHEYFTEIETHFHKRQKNEHLMTQLAQRTTQFRAIERRLLARFKDKTPSPLTNLDTLLDGTYRQILMVVDALEESNRELRLSSSKLISITNLLLILARLSTGMSEEDTLKLRAALSPVIHLNQDQGWEETTDAGLTFLLRTSLAKPGKENQGATPITLDKPKDVTRLKKHISSTLDRIAKGARINDDRNVMEKPELLDMNSVTRKDSEPASGKTATVNEFGDDDGSGFKAAAPDELEAVGAKIGMKSERLMSARSRQKPPSIQVSGPPQPDAGENSAAAVAAVAAVPHPGSFSANGDDNNDFFGDDNLNDDFI